MTFRPIPVLLYHSVSGRDSFAVTPGRFARHAEAIAACGRTPLTMSELADGLRGLRALPEQCVAITFDDGYRDTVGAIETLRGYGLCSTLYVTSGCVGDEDALTAQQVGTLAGWQDSVELGAHTVTHRRLDELGSLAAQREIRDSKDAVEQLAGRCVNSFAYPHGAFDDHVRGLVIDAGYTSAGAVKNALSHRHDDPFAIARWTVRSTTSIGDLGAVLNGSGAPRAWRGQRVRTRAFRVVRRVHRRLSRDHVRARSPA
jgi:peptidoglycan/xylan/chitin deacetylase (PgdA/CDA1 family)